MYIIKNLLTKNEIKMTIDWKTVIAVVIALAIFQILNKVVLEKLIDKLPHFDEII